MPRPCPGMTRGYWLNAAVFHGRLGSARREQRGSRGHAKGLLAVGTLKQRSRDGKAIDVRGNHRFAIGAQFRSQVVDGDEQDVEFLLNSLRLAATGKADEQCNRADRDAEERVCRQGTCCHRSSSIQVALKSVVFQPSGLQSPASIYNVKDA